MARTPSSGTPTPRKSPLRVVPFPGGGSPHLPQPSPRPADLTGAQLRAMQVSEFAQWLRSRTNQEKRPFQEETITAYKVAARALDAWMTTREMDGDFTACDTATLNLFFRDYNAAHAQGGTNTKQRNLRHPFSSARVVLPAVLAQQCGAELGPVGAALVAMPGGGKQARVAEREQVGRDRCRAERGHGGERGRGHGPVQAGQDECAGAAEQPGQRVRRRRGRLPEPGDAGGGVDDGREPGLLGDRGDAGPQVGAGHQEESALADLDGAVAAVSQAQPVGGPAQLRVQLIQGAQAAPC